MLNKNTSTPKPGPNSKHPQLAEGQLEPLFQRLNLAHTRRIYQDVADRAEKENWSYVDFLALLLAEEVAHRKQTRLQRCTRQARFPFFKTIDEFDFSLQTTLRQSLLGSYLGPDFVTEGRSLILYGKTGRGKTHLAVAIGYRAIQNGFETLCTTAAELVEELSNASSKGRLQESLQTYTRPHVLLVDEVGYLTYGPDAANVLFHVVNHRHLRKRPLIFTTNKPLSEWGKVLHDEDLAAAILDRVLERGRLIHLDGPSGRTRHLNLEEPLPAAAERARISGIRVPEFPEPTCSNETEHRGLDPLGLESVGASIVQNQLGQLEEPIRTVALVCVSFGLRISEALALKWSDVDWLNGTLLIERGIVRQRVGSVKTADSEQKVSADREMLKVMSSWRQTTMFASESDWVFASPGQIGRLPISYPWVWRSFQQGAVRAGMSQLISGDLVVCN